MLNIKTKKDFQTIEIKNLLKKAQFVSFSYTNLLNTKDHIDLRKELVKHNLTIKVIKNSVFFNAVNLTNLKNLVPFAQGFIVLIIPVDFDKDIDITILKDLSKVLKSHTNLLFLGGLFKGTLFNKLLLNKVSKLESRDLVFSKLVSTLNSIPMSFVNLTKQPLNRVSYNLSQKVSHNL